MAALSQNQQKISAESYNTNSLPPMLRANSCKYTTVTDTNVARLWGNKKGGHSSTFEEIAPPIFRANSSNYSCRKQSNKSQSTTITLPILRANSSNYTLVQLLLMS